MAAEAASPAGLVIEPLVFLAAAVVVVPVFKRLGLGSVLGYLAAGVAIGPFALGLFGDPASVLHVAELGIVLFLFLIGLELEPSRLWAMRRDIFGLGTAQVLVAGLAIAATVMLLGGAWRTAVVAAAGLALSSTAIVMQMLNERGETRTPVGEKAFAILLLQDLAIVPLLALVAFIAPGPADAGDGLPIAAAKFVGAVGVVVLVGRYLLNPMFSILARFGGREIMTAAALMVVLGAAAVMAFAGLSMALGAFLAGVLLAESNFRHQLEADIEPFRGILMGLFFLSVGMSVDLKVIAQQWMVVAGGLALLLVVKFVACYGVARIGRQPHPEAVAIAALLVQGGEFGFVLYQGAAASGAIGDTTASILVAVTTLSMAVTPPIVALARRLTPQPVEVMPEADFSDARGTVLVIGFGRFGQIASQLLLFEGYDTTIIDNDPDMIRSASRFGFKIYYGDGTRLDVLRAARADSAKLIAVCTDKREVTDRIVDLIVSEFPYAKLYVRAFDRGHLISLNTKNVDYSIRETYESAIAFGRQTLVGLGLDPERAAAVETEMRRRDAERLALQEVGGIYAGKGLMPTGQPAEPEPTPLVEPKRGPKALTPETASVAGT